ncbi:hypothetical protein Tco_1420296 [Tanacetum coccineum]
MIACVEKTAQNADFYQIIDYLTGCSINYSLLVDPDLIGPWLQQFWTTASLRVINDVPHIRAMVAGKKILISEETICAHLLFDDANGVDCFPKQVIWDTLRDIGYEGNLAQLTFSKPLFSPQWKYLVHVLLHCLSPKSTSWEQFGTNIDLPFSLPSKVFTFMRKHSPKFSCRITPLTPSMLEVVTALAAEEEHSTSPHSRAASSARDAQGTPTQSAAPASISQGTTDVQGTANSQGTASLQGTAASLGTAHAQDTDDVQDTDPAQGTAAIPKSPNDYTPTDTSKTSGGDEGLLDLYALNREPVVKHHAFWVESQNLKKQKRRRKKQRKKMSSVKLGRNKEEGTLSEEHYVQEEDTGDPFFDDIVDKDAAVAPDIDRKSNETEVLERKSDETEEINIEDKEASNIKSGDTEELDLETTQSSARQSTITPRTLNFEDEAGPSSPLRPIQVMESKEQLKVAEVLVAISRPRGKGILVEEPKKKKLTLQQIRALETTNDEEVARKIQAEWDAEEEGKKMKELYDKVKESIEDSYKDFIPIGSEKERLWLQERNAKRHSRKRKATISEGTAIQDAHSLRTEVVDEFRNYLRVGDFEYIIWETAESSDDDFWKDQEEWEIIRWRFHESSGVHTLELEDGTMIHMLAERRYPLSRELMIRMLDHGMEVEDESETAITLIHLFILWTTEDGDNS